MASDTGDEAKTVCRSVMVFESYAASLPSIDHVEIFPEYRYRVIGRENLADPDYYDRLIQAARIFGMDL